MAHAAPEVLEGAPPSEAVDVWALLSTLHTMLAGRPPFTGCTVHLRSGPAPCSLEADRFGSPAEVAPPPGTGGKRRMTPHL